ncbi:nicotinate-nucleotide--dimethylbenzimidazole phosphoribosyltransferase [Streptomyces himalayensis]|uniref:Nicotinate-nucleotide--dimethylbenzimidazole phosphoribosyltransferase n=1 Tax=Streptomyces himalayensis subsp. himalayensis TaxID=2756131 RepID=A0A7W0DJL4_9ACTN|nr:nicotinate-nucleotide--dimethylbenzimidazole phosphoribosyltransferase [Streptomyces himalayensis]MBA2946317.1 nicotinate-nucleotide--dimethylbenzimidazole phosphoribosyltransferase [Streptomyces himalayensis subsp. himalayensis]
MTDTGQGPGEGLPESAGMVEQPGVSAPGAYTYLGPSENPADDDDLLLMPGAQGAWSEGQTPAPAAVAHEPGPHEMAGRDSGSVDLSGVRVPAPAPSPSPVVRRPLHLGPPVPDSSASPVRSLADRGPASRPPTPVSGRHAGPPTSGPEYLDIPGAGTGSSVAQATGETAPGAATAWAPQAHPEAVAAVHGTPAETVGPDTSAQPAPTAGADVPDAADAALAPSITDAALDPAATDATLDPSAAGVGQPTHAMDAGQSAHAMDAGSLASGADAAAQIQRGEEAVQPPQSGDPAYAQQAPAEFAYAPHGGQDVQAQHAGVAAAHAGYVAQQAADGAQFTHAADAHPQPGQAPAPDAGAHAFPVTTPPSASVFTAESGQFAYADESAPAGPPSTGEQFSLDLTREAEPVHVPHEAQALNTPFASDTVQSDTVQAEQSAGFSDATHGSHEQSYPGTLTDEAMPVAQGDPLAHADQAQQIPATRDEVQAGIAFAAADVQAVAETPAAPTGVALHTEGASTQLEASGVPEGSDVLPDGSGVLPDGSDVLPEGSGVLPEASGVLPAGSGEVPVASALEAHGAQPIGEFVPVEGSVPTTPHLAPTPPHALKVPPVPALEEQAEATVVANAETAEPTEEAPQPVAVAPEPVAEPIAAPADTQVGAPVAVTVDESAVVPAEEPSAVQDADDTVVVPAEETPVAPAEATPDALADGTPVAPAGETTVTLAETQTPVAPAQDDVAEPAAGTAEESSQDSEPEPESLPEPAPAVAPVPEPESQPEPATAVAPVPEQGTAPVVPEQEPVGIVPEQEPVSTVPEHEPLGTVPAPRDGEQPTPVPTAEAAPVPDRDVQEPEPLVAQNADSLDTQGAPEATAEGEAEAVGLAGIPGQQAGPPAPGYEDAEREAVLRVMRERRDIRNGFRSDPIPHEVLLRVLEAAHTAPSVGHSQPWDFVVIRSAETRQTMHELAMRQREAYAKSLPKGRAKQFKELKIEAILETPVNIVVTADPTRGGRHTLGRHTQPQMAPYSSALAVENLWLAARAEGLGVGWVSFFDEREMVRTLGLPEHLEVVAYLCVGYVEEFPEEPELMQAGWSKRRPLSWVVHEETYGRRALPGEQPHDLLAETVAGIRPLDAKALGEAWERQKRMTKPSGALGMLEIISAQLCGLSRMCPPPIPEPAAVAIFAGDHGVHAQGVTPWPQEVTGQMVANFLGGGAVCNAFANQVGAEVCIIDVGVASDLPATPGLLPRKVRAGTADMTTGPALTREEVRAAIEVGIETARDLVAAGNKALLTGEMGIANTTASAALISVFTGADPAEVTGRGTGINDEMLARKTEVVRRALELHQPDPTDPIGVLAAVGGLEHAAMAGLLLGGASLRTPVILDGVSAGAAALVARAIAPEVLAACIAGHRSAEPGHMAALNKLGLRPLVDLDLRLGEGTGALLALPLVQSAARAMHEVATFDSAGVTEK